MRKSWAVVVVTAVAIAGCRTGPPTRPAAVRTPEPVSPHVRHRLSELCSVELEAHAEGCILRDSSFASGIGNMLEKSLQCGQTDDKCHQKVTCECEAREDAPRSRGGQPVASGFASFEERAGDELRWSIDCRSSGADCAPRFPDIKMDIQCPGGERCFGMIRRESVP